jgi:Tfp pilus assembly protein PilF
VAWHAAQLEVRRGDLQAALRALLDLERMAETGVFDKRASYPAPVLGLALWNNLAIVAHKLGRREVARRNYERVLAAQPNNAAVREALNRM